MSKELNNAPTSAMLEQMHRVDKPYAATEKGEIVAPGHPMAVRIIAHYNSQEVPGPLLADYGLLTSKGFVPQPYQEVEFVEVAAPLSALQQENAKLLAEIEALKAAAAKK